MQNLAKTHKTLTVVNDQHGRPTWTRTLAEFMTFLAENRKEFGYYHLSNDATEDTTWYDFAVEILKDTDVEVKPVDSSQFPAKAKRPLNSTMSLAKAKATGFVIPTWQDALKEFYKQDLKNSLTLEKMVTQRERKRILFLFLFTHLCNRRTIIKIQEKACLNVRKFEHECFFCVIIFCE